MRRPHLSPATRGLALAALTATLGGLLLAACQRPAPAPTGAALRSVVVAAVSDGSLGETLRIVGVLAPRDEVRLSFKVGGVVESVGVEEGSIVRKGQLLASLHATEVESQVRQAKEAADKAERDLARGRALYDDGVATREQLDDLTTLTATTRAGLAAATFNARYARIEAPADGVVLRKLVQAHELVQAGQPVLSVSSLDRGWIVRGAFADRDVVRVGTGDEGTVTLDAFPGRRFRATVQTVGSAADPQTGTFTVEFRVEPAGAAFAQGMVAKIEIERPARDARTVPLLPLSALVEADGDNGFVYVLDGSGDVVHRRNVRLAGTDRSRVAVADGVRVGEQVVIEGAAFVSDGEKVRVVAAGAKASAAGTGSAAAAH